MRSIGTEYGWPDIHPAVHAEIKLPHQTLARYVGAYRMSPGVYMTIRLSDELLISRLTGQGNVPLFAEAEGKFFPKVVQAELDFVEGSDGKVTAVVCIRTGTTSPGE